MRKTINIKIASDIVCPWCYIGKKNLQKAIETLKEEYKVEVQYLPFQLDASVPDEGVNFREHITQKFGDWERFLRGSQRLVDYGKEVGIQFDMNKIGKSPNTFKMHRIVQFAHQFGLQLELKEAFFRAYFEDHIDLTTDEMLINIAKSAGLDEEHVRTLLQSNEGSDEVRALEENVRSLGITGVPYFIIDDRYGISGAVPAEQLISAIKQSASETISDS